MGLKQRRIVRFWVDGGMLGPRNPSPEGVFWSVFCQEAGSGGEGNIVVERKRSTQHHTNNEAEWLALIEAYRYALRYYPDAELEIFSDSQLIVNQFNCRWRVKQPHLYRLAKQAWIVAAYFSRRTVRWRPRREMVKRLGH